MIASYIHPADQIVMFMQRIYDKGLTTTSGGNLSIRDAQGNIWITPAGIDKGTLTRRDIICVTPTGDVIGPHRPSSELPFHAGVYRRRPDLRAVLHAHPPALVSFSILRRLPSLDLMPTVRKLCPEMKMAAYAVPGSEALGENISTCFAEGCDCVLLENHGVCVGAPDLFTAFQRFETLNHTAQLELLASRLGNVKTLAPEDYRRSNTQTHLTMEEFQPADRTAEELAARRDMITLIRRSYRQGLFAATHGTYSVRLADGSFLITPFGRDRAYLEPEDLVLVRGAQREAGKIPSRAVALHGAVYEAHPETRAVLQAHPVHAMAFAVTDADCGLPSGDPFLVYPGDNGEPWDSIRQSYILLREIRRIPYGQLYENPRVLAEVLAPACPAILAENDCVAVTGDSLLQAFDRLEVLESTAESILDAMTLGNIVHISPAEAANLKVAFHLED